MTEEYASYLMACALLPLSISVQAGTGRAKELLMLLIAGFILCLTIFLKEPFILNFPAFMILALSSEGNIRKSILRILVMLGGALLCACFFIAANFNALGEWLKVIDYNVHYSGGGIPMLQKMLLLFKVIFLWYIPLNFLVFAFCLAALIVSAASGAFRNPAAKFRTDARARLLAFAAVLFITASLASGIQGKFFGHYFLALTLPVALAAVFSLELCFRNKILRAALALSIVLALGYALLFESLGLRHSKCDVLAKLTSFPGWFFRTLNPVGARFTYPPLIGRGILLVDFPDNVIREREFILDVINGDKSDFTIQNYSDFTLVYLLTGKMSAARHFMYFPHFFIDSSSSTGKEKLDGHIGEIREKRPKYIIKEKYEIPYVPSDYRRIEMSYYDLLIRPD